MRSGIFVRRSAYRRRWLLGVFLWCCPAEHPASADDLSGAMLQTVVKGQKLEGLPLAWSADRVHLVARDGRLWEFSPGEAQDYQQTSGYFRGYSAAEMRSALERELGDHLDVTGTSHYLVAHPRGQGGQWAERFENLYRSFVHYFAVRGFRTAEPPFPLVAIVWTREQDFFRFAAGDGNPVGPGVLGYYSPKTNRIALFDSSGGQKKGKEWEQDASTIIHEVTHQTAFNCSVHSRFILPPRWLAEGLGTLYEARGIYDSRTYQSQSDRVNRGRLKQFRQLVSSGRPACFFMELAGSDRIFSQSPGAAYAESWAFSFFLSETEPKKYCDYLALTMQGKPFDTPASAERVAQFVSVFGRDVQMLDAHFLRFMEGIQ